MEACVRVSERLRERTKKDFRERERVRGAVYLRIYEPSLENWEITT